MADETFSFGPATQRRLRRSKAACKARKGSWRRWVMTKCYKSKRSRRNARRMRGKARMAARIRRANPGISWGMALRRAWSRR